MQQWTLLLTDQPYCCKVLALKADREKMQEKLKGLEDPAAKGQPSQADYDKLKKMVRQ